MTRIPLEIVRFVSDERFENYQQTAQLKSEGDVRGRVRLTYLPEIAIVEVVLPADTDGDGVTTWMKPVWIPLGRVARMAPEPPTPAKAKP